MPCDQSQFLTPYLDGELSTDQAQAVATHLATCPSCAAEWDELQALGRLMAVARRSNWGEPEAESLQRLRLHVRDLVETSDLGLLRMARFFTGIAASVLLAGIWLVYQAPRSAAQPVPVEQIVLQTLLTPESEAAEPVAAPAISVVGSADLATRDTVLARLTGIADSGANADSEVP